MWDMDVIYFGFLERNARESNDLSDESGRRDVALFVIYKVRFTGISSHHTFVKNLCALHFPFFFFIEYGGYFYSIYFLHRDSWNNWPFVNSGICIPLYSISDMIQSISSLKWWKLSHWIIHLFVIVLYFTIHINVSLGCILYEEVKGHIYIPWITLKIFATLKFKSWF